ncbi:uncharacterized protein LOC131247114 [Magnolia sinica]|uniref:uncharacterized protein LOC131247114 n=1 Tax=Magnolia sinica TaxID=86752 RepID=UPI00265B39BA|nr:uncharacterized protein LOC131247114 [Magnolia sinica]
MACVKKEEEDVRHRHADVPIRKKMIMMMMMAYSKTEEEEKEEEDSGIERHAPVPIGKLLEDFQYRESPSCSSTSRNVVIVMDALKGFSLEPLKWALVHVIKPGFVVTLLGVMPWLNFCLSCKTWLHVWTLNLDDLHALREISEWKNYRKYQTVRAVLELCEKYRVIPNMKVAMGDPLRLVAVEHITNLHAAWVVFDKHQRKNKAFYAKKIPCNMVMMKSDGEVEMLRVRPMIQSSENVTPEQSPAPKPLVPKVMISKEWMEILNS